jgi:hypothetical protein
MSQSGVHPFCKFPVGKHLVGRRDGAGPKSFLYIRNSPMFTGLKRPLGDAGDLDCMIFRTHAKIADEATGTRKLLMTFFLSGCTNESTTNCVSMGLEFAALH